jgi:4-amino-4-deoxy-L-arabinose transferase-like glycosyltransferase
MTSRAWKAGLLLVTLVYLHNTLPYLTTMPRVNVDEPWLMERAYQVMRTGVPSQPMLGLQHAYLLQVGYGYLLAVWMFMFGVGLLQARLLGVLLGLGIVLLVAWMGRRMIDPATGLSAALFIALDSNFLGGVRNARTDIPSLFFITCALAAYLRGRYQSRLRWFVASGASLGLAILCHGNAFWAGLILLAWCLLDYRRRTLAVPYGYAVLGGFLLTFGPYLAVVVLRWRDVQAQIGNFAADRVPSWRPGFLLHQMQLEVQRYRGWYFGLVTNTVPNPLLWAFQIAIIVGLVALIVRIRSADKPSIADPDGPVRLLLLAVGSVLIFGAFINNKVPVYLPHILIGLSLVAGFAVSEGLGRRRSTAVFLFLVGYGGAGVGYYEKWYASVLKGELVSYETTTTTLRALVPNGSKYVFASPQFWTPFHAESSTTFYSYAAAQPSDSGSRASLPGVSDSAPIFLLIDELQWLPELTGNSSSTPQWQQDWIAFIERRCTVDGVAYGTAHGTIALFRCGLAGAPPARPPRIVGAEGEYRIGDLVSRQMPVDLARWPRYEDPRRTTAARPEVRLTPHGLEISGTGWPGIVDMFAAAPGECYLVKADASRTRDGDLLYLGTWQQSQVRSLAGSSSAGIPASLTVAGWFPHERAFRATAPAVRLLLYSEAPQTDFLISSVEIYRLLPTPPSRPEPTP